MRKYTFPFVCLLALLLSCSGGKNDVEVSRQLTPAKGGRYYGGIFNMNESEYVSNLFPLSIVDIYSYRVATQIYEGLLKFDQKNLSIIPSLAESYDVSDDKRVYVFHLRKGVNFHDDSCFPGSKGRELKASDIEYCFKKICTQSRENQSFYLFKDIVKGANDYYESTKENPEYSGKLEGVTVVDDYTVQIELEQPNSIFLYNLCRPGALIYPQEAYDRYGLEMREKCVGTGPFMLASLDEDISIMLYKNKGYYGVDEFGNQLPFLDAINIKFIKEKKIELLEFQKGNLDMMYRLPTDYIFEILEGSQAGADGSYSQYDLQRTPEMSTQILVLNNQNELFKDINVRKALNFAIDRDRILNQVLNGEGYEFGKYGITPPSFKNYDVKRLTGFQFNVDSARYYLQKAGYKNGAGFPTITLDLNAEGARYTNMAIDVQKQLKDHLGINMEFNIAPMAKIKEKSMGGDFELLRLAWVADYPSPENFLWFFYGKGVPDKLGQPSYPNIARYKNDQVDEYYEKGVHSISEEDALQNFMKAEQIAMEDAPIIVLWYDEGYRLMQSYIKNFPNNSMQYRDFSEVYMIEAPKTEEKQQ